MTQFLRIPHFYNLALSRKLLHSLMPILWYLLHFGLWNLFYGLQIFLQHAHCTYAYCFYDAKVFFCTHIAMWKWRIHFWSIHIISNNALVYTVLSAKDETSETTVVNLFFYNIHDSLLPYKLVSFFFISLKYSLKDWIQGRIMTESDFVFQVVFTVSTFLGNPVCLRIAP